MTDFNITVSTYSSIEDFMNSNEFKSFDAHCNQYMSDVKAKAQENLTDEQKEEFLQWWENRMPEGFWNTRSNETFNAILYAISMGGG